MSECDERLPDCRHRGVQFEPGRWFCGSDRLIVPGRQVTTLDCLRLCPYVDRPDDSERERAELTRFDRPRPVVTGGARIAVGVVSAPRRLPTVEQTIAHLRAAGFTGAIGVFEEPGTGVRRRAGVDVATNATRLGMWANWLQAARRLLERTTAPYVLICEDDVAFCRSAALALEAAIAELPVERWGLASLYTARHHQGGLPSRREGWQAFNWTTPHWGALAYCFSRRSLRGLLESSAVRRHEGDESTDVVVGAAMQELGLDAYYHLPSLADHTGSGVSSSGHHDPLQAGGWGFSPRYIGYVPAPAPTALGPIDWQADDEDAHPPPRLADDIELVVRLKQFGGPFQARWEGAVRRAFEHFPLVRLEGATDATAPAVGWALRRSLYERLSTSPDWLRRLDAYADSAVRASPWRGREWEAYGDWETALVEATGGRWGRLGGAEEAVSDGPGEGSEAGAGR